MLLVRADGIITISRGKARAEAGWGRAFLYPVQQGPGQLPPWLRCLCNVLSAAYSDPCKIQSWFLVNYPCKTLVYCDETTWQENSLIPLNMQSTHVQQCKSQKSVRLRRASFLMCRPTASWLKETLARKYSYGFFGQMKHICNLFHHKIFNVKKEN
jgi:hypothetical protein